MNEKFSKVSGFLIEVKEHAFNRNDFAAGPRLRYDGNIGTTRWEIYHFSSPYAYRSEHLMGLEAPYIYPLYVRRSGGRALVVSPTRRAVQTVIDQDLRRVFGAELMKVAINVDAMVRAMVVHPAEYTLTYLHALMSSLSEVKSISLFGEDLGGARFVQDNLQLMNVVSCGVRRIREKKLEENAGVVEGAEDEEEEEQESEKRTEEDLSEALRIGSDGYISFYYRGADSLRAVESGLHFLRERGYLLESLLEP